MTQEHQTLRLNILSHLIITTLWVKYSIKITRKKGLLDKFHISGFIDNSDLDKRISSLATKAEQKSDQDKVIKLEAFNSS